MENKKREWWWITVVILWWLIIVVTLWGVLCCGTVSDAVGTQEGSLQPHKVYVVKRGDCLERIAKVHRVSVKQLAEVNNIHNVNLLYLGQRLIIPVSPDKIAALKPEPKELPSLKMPLPITKKRELEKPPADVKAFSTAISQLVEKESKQPPPPTSSKPIELKVTVGGAMLVETQDLKRVATSNPQIADVAVVSEHEFLVNGKSAGEATLYVWDRRGTIAYHVVVEAYETNILARLKEALKLPKVDVKLINDSIVLEGMVDNPEEARRAELIASAYAKKVLNLIELPKIAPPPPATVQQAAEIGKAIGIEGITVQVIDNVVLLDGQVPTQRELQRALSIAEAFGKRVVNLIRVTEVPEVPQISVKARITEIDRTALRQLGLEWGGISPTGVFSPYNFMFGQPAVGERVRALDSLGIQLSALAQEGRARILAEPNLLVLSGNTANIVVGGEIPIPVSQVIAGAVGTVTVQWKDYGVKLNIKPTVVEGEPISLEVIPEVSTLDWENAVSYGLVRIPGLRTRRAQTVVQIKSGDTLVIGGLIQKEEAKQLKKLPLLGDLPVIGPLFRSERFTKGETELVIFVTPQLVKGEAPAKSSSKD